MATKTVLTAIPLFLAAMGRSLAAIEFAGTGAAVYEVTCWTRENIPPGYNPGQTHWEYINKSNVVRCADAPFVRLRFERDIDSQRYYADVCTGTVSLTFHKSDAFEASIRWAGPAYYTPEASMPCGDSERTLSAAVDLNASFPWLASASFATANGVLRMSDGWWSSILDVSFTGLVFRSSATHSFEHTSLEGGRSVDGGWVFRREIRFLSLPRVNVPSIEITLPNAIEFGQAYTNISLRLRDAGGAPLAENHWVELRAEPNILYPHGDWQPGIARLANGAAEIGYNVMDEYWAAFHFGTNIRSVVVTADDLSANVSASGTVAVGSSRVTVTATPNDQSGNLAAAIMPFDPNCPARITAAVQAIGPLSRQGRRIRFSLPTGPTAGALYGYRFLNYADSREITVPTDAEGKASIWYHCTAGVTAGGLRESITVTDLDTGASGLATVRIGLGLRFSDIRPLQVSTDNREHAMAALIGSSRCPGLRLDQYAQQCAETWDGDEFRVKFRIHWINNDAAWSSFWGSSQAYSDDCGFERVGTNNILRARYSPGYTVGSHYLPGIYLLNDGNYWFDATVEPVRYPSGQGFNPKSVSITDNTQRQAIYFVIDKSTAASWFQMVACALSPETKAQYIAMEFIKTCDPTKAPTGIGLVSLAMGVQRAVCDLSKGDYAKGLLNLGATLGGSYYNYLTGKTDLNERQKILLQWLFYAKEGRESFNDVKAMVPSLFPERKSTATPILDPERQSEHAAFVAGLLSTPAGNECRLVVVGGTDAAMLLDDQGRPATLFRPDIPAIELTDFLGDATNGAACFCLPRNAAATLRLQTTQDTFVAVFEGGTPGSEVYALLADARADGVLDLTEAGPGRLQIDRNADGTFEAEILPERMRFADRGTLVVSIGPAGVVATGATWRVADGDWMAPGLASVLTTGRHTVAFSDVEGWTTPPAVTVTVPGGGTARVDVVYAPRQNGRLTVHIEPAEAAGAGARWRVSGGAWLASGAALSLEPGQYRLDFSALDGWVRPRSRLLTVPPGGDASVTGAYERRSSSYYFNFTGGQSTGWVDDGSGRWSASSGAMKMTGNGGATGHRAFVHYDLDVCDFLIEADVLKETGDSERYDAYGFILRGDGSGSNQYQFAINTGSSYAIGRCVNGTVETLVPWTESEPLNWGYSQWNTLKVLAQGSTLNFYVNNVLVETLYDGTFSCGRLGLYALDNTDFTGPDTVKFDAVRVVTYARLTPWTEAVEMGGGWCWLDWFGLFTDAVSPWIYHGEHGWMYPIGDDPASLWFWTPGMGWLWTGEGVYPWMYGVSRSAWLWYARQSSPRVFYDTATGQWFWPDVP